jgi:hypothetical protein
MVLSVIYISSFSLYFALKKYTKWIPIIYFLEPPVTRSGAIPHASRRTPMRMFAIKLFSIVASIPIHTAVSYDFMILWRLIDMCRDGILIW